VAVRDGQRCLLLPGGAGGGAYFGHCLSQWLYTGGWLEALSQVAPLSKWEASNTHANILLHEKGVAKAMNRQRRCPECPVVGTPAGIRRHRSSKHNYPARAEYIDRFFDHHEKGSAPEILEWLQVNYPEGNWPYQGWSQAAVSRDLAQHNNYPRRWVIVCAHRGPRAVWERIGPTDEVAYTGERRGDEAVISRVKELERLLVAAQSELRLLKTLV
jgi:hypothetical protein